MRTFFPVPAAPPLSLAEQQALLALVWPLLARQASLYTMGEATSLPTATAARLLDGLRYTLGVDDPARARALLAAGAAAAAQAHRSGCRRAQAQAEQLQAVWQAVCRSLPAPRSEAMADTLRSIGGALAQYDSRFFPQEAFCAIDYPLAQPVDESLPGLRYLAQYLARLGAENRFLRAFPPAQLSALLAAWQPDWAQLCLNLYEPAAANAVGRALADLASGAPPAALPSLCIARCELPRLADLLSPLPRPQGLALLARAAARAAQAAGLTGRAQRRYLTQTAQALWPRIQAALPGGHLDGVFLPLSPSP